VTVRSTETTTWFDAVSTPHAVPENATDRSRLCTAAARRAVLLGPGLAPAGDAAAAAMVVRPTVATTVAVTRRDKRVTLMKVSWG
jgi:hypothetical protein